MSHHRAPTHLGETRLTLGESPTWDARSDELLHVDIEAGAVYAWSHDGLRLAYVAGGRTGFAVPRHDRGYVVGVERTVFLIDGEKARALTSVELGRPANRFNDARCDAAGRLWAGTMSLERDPGVATLYRIDPDGACEPVLRGLTISNGIGWSPDGDRMFHIDSTTQRINVFDFDAEAGRISGRRTLVTIASADGLPDGLAVDVDGGVWVALFGGGEVRRYGSQGTLDEVVRLPVTNCTCPAFGGPDLTELFVTSATHKLSPSQRLAQPLAGAVFRLTPGVRGVAPNAFAG